MLVEGMHWTNVDKLDPEKRRKTKTKTKKLPHPEEEGVT